MMIEICIHSSALNISRTTSCWFVFVFTQPQDWTSAATWNNMVSFMNIMWWPLSYGFLWLLTRNEACQFQPHIIWVKPHLHPYADSNCWCRNVQPAGAWYAGDGWESWAAPTALKVVTESLLVPMICAIVDEQINQTKEDTKIRTSFRTFWWYANHIVVNRQAIFSQPKDFWSCWFVFGVLEHIAMDPMVDLFEDFFLSQKDPRDFKKLRGCWGWLQVVSRNLSVGPPKRICTLKDLSRVTGIILRITLKWQCFPTNFEKKLISILGNACMLAVLVGVPSFFR